MFDFLKKPSQDSRIELPSVTVEFNHRTKTVFLYVDNPAVTDAAFEELDAHFKKRGYTLVVFKPSPNQAAARRPTADGL